MHIHEPFRWVGDLPWDETIFKPIAVLVFKDIEYSRNFCMVQNFAVFVDRSAAVKIKTTKISMYSALHVS